MAGELPIRRVAWFCAKLCFWTPICLVIWWLIVPYYVKGIGEVCALALNGFGYGISEAVAIREEPPQVADNSTIAEPFYTRFGEALERNAKTQLGFKIGNRTPSIPIVELVTNIAVFIALMLASSGLGFLRLLLRTALGAAILIATHCVYVFAFFVWSAAIARNQTVFIAAGQVLLTLPFVLWIALAYFAEPQKSPNTPKNSYPAP